MRGRYLINSVFGKALKGAVLEDVVLIGGCQIRSNLLYGVAFYGVELASNHFPAFLFVVLKS